MIIDNSYFIDDIFIPHAKPSITDNVTAISSDITSFIDTYSREALIKCLGYPLFKEFSLQLDSSKDNGLKDGADEKWNKLLNGAEYIGSDGKPTEWKGIRFKTSNKYNKSFLADYVYFFYEQSQNDDRAGVGNVQQESKNATIVSKTPKVVFAWRRFVKAVQGEATMPTYIDKGYQNYHEGYAIGVDYYGRGEETYLYRFIIDSNKTDATTYPDFNPMYFKTMNQFGV